MSQLSLAELVLAARRTVQDVGTGRASTVLDEQLGGVDGVKTRFRLLYFPVVSGSQEVRKNGALLATPADYTIDLTNGVITFTVAPAITPSMDQLEVVYRFLWFIDEDYNEFLADAAVFAGFPPTGTDAATRAASVAANYPDTLLDALLSYVGYLFNMRRADEYAHRFASSSGGQSANVDVVTKNFRDLANMFHEKATTARDDFYKRKGARAAPALATSSYKPAPSVLGPFGSPRR